MKYFLSLIIVFFCITSLYSQEKRFVFIQSDNNLPFYVSLNGKNYSSSSSGYIIIPKLTNGDYKINIGFAKNLYPEQTFNLSINNRDLGLNLKNFPDKGWGLFDLQTLNVSMATGETATSGLATTNTEGQNSEDDYVINFNKKKKAEVKEPVIEKKQTVTLADTALTATAKPVETALPATSNAELSTKSEETLRDTVLTAEVLKVEKVQSVEPILTINPISKVSEVKASEGVYLSYVDSASSLNDTIQVIIPFQKISGNGAVSAASTENKEIVTSKPDSATATVNPSSSTNSGSTASKSANNDTINSGGGAAVTTKPASTTANKIMPNSNCKAEASEEDYARLRKKMAEQTNDEKMISEAKKFYRNKCFTTSQVKRMSTLFLSDEGRFKFFEASFGAVTDSTQYPSLQTEFVDPGFAERFKSLFN